MSIEMRLAQMKAYREEAMKHPLVNRLYIEDLNLSIEMFEAHLKLKQPIMGSKWSDTN